jgi:hypothetical protein
MYLRVHPLFIFPLDIFATKCHTRFAKLLRTRKGEHMAQKNGGTQPTELTIAGVTLIFDQDVPPRTRGNAGSSKWDDVMEAIRERNSEKAVLLQGVKPASASGFKKNYPDLHFATRGGKTNPAVYVATTAEALKETVPA